MYLVQYCVMVNYIYRQTPTTDNRQQTSQESEVDNGRARRHGLFLQKAAWTGKPPAKIRDVVHSIHTC